MQVPVMNNEKFKTLWASFGQNEWPTLLDYSTAMNADTETISVEIKCHVPADLSWFAGHFPEQPVLPGVVQTHWAGELSAVLFPVGDFQQVNGLKFKSMILPDTHVILSLVFKAEKSNVAFRYESVLSEHSHSKSSSEVFTTGSLLFK